MVFVADICWNFCSCYHKLNVFSNGTTKEVKQVELHLFSSWFIESLDTFTSLGQSHYRVWETCHAPDLFAYTKKGILQHSLINIFKWQMLRINKKLIKKQVEGLLCFSRQRFLATAGRRVCRKPCNSWSPAGSSTQKKKVSSKQSRASQ